jgi:hypothetical protein
MTGFWQFVLPFFSGMTIGSSGLLFLLALVHNGRGKTTRIESVTPELN